MGNSSNNNTICYIHLPRSFHQCMNNLKTMSGKYYIVSFVSFVSDLFLFFFLQSLISHCRTIRLQQRQLGPSVIIYGAFTTLSISSPIHTRSPISLVLGKYSSFHSFRSILLISFFFQSLSHFCTKDPNSASSKVSQGKGPVIIHTLSISSPIHTCSPISLLSSAKSALI